MNKPALSALTHEQKKILFISAMGGMLEFYDFVIYIFFVHIIDKVFFSSDSHALANIKAFIIFASGYLLRPFGGIIFSHFGDRYGRKIVFSLTVLFMAIPSFGIALLPGSASIGIAAPLLLMLLRLLQSLALGGEIPAAITFVYEYVDASRHAFATATLFFGINLGLLLGSFMADIINSSFSPAILYSWGWRIPFALGRIAGLVAMYLRKQVQETQAFNAIVQQARIKKIPFVTLIQTSSKIVFTNFWLIGLGSVTIFFYLYIPGYLHEKTGFGLDKLLAINTYGILLFSIAILITGLLADKFGYKRIYMIGAIILFVTMHTLFALLKHKQIDNIIVAYSLFSLIFSSITATYPAMIAESFPTEIRYNGIALSYNLAYTLFCGFSPLICTLLSYYIKSFYIPALYIMTVAFLAIIFSMRAKTTL